jgi:methyl-accepting chemotaxis protein
MNQKRKLGNLLINKSFQFKYIFWITLTGLVVIAIYTAVFYLYVSENYWIFVDLSLMEDDAKALLYRELRVILFSLGGFSLLFLAVVSFIGLVISHRVAGPLYHFKRVFKALNAGNLTERVRLRPKDDFRDVADECNAMLDRITRIPPPKA